MADQSRTVGRGITEGSKPKVITFEDFDDEALEGAVKYLAVNVPDAWPAFHAHEHLEHMRDLLGKLAECYIGGELPAHFYEEKVGRAWYIQELTNIDREIKAHIKAGNSSWAAYEGCRFGMLFQEMLVKFTWEDFAMLGAETAEQRRAGGAATRKGSDAERVELVRQYLAKGDKLTEAYRNAANDLGCGVSTVRGSWARLTKGADASD